MPGAISPGPVTLNTSTASRPPGRINAEDPAYAEEIGNHRVPDPPHKPFPPRYCPGRRIRNRLRISFLASAAPPGHRPPATVVDLDPRETRVLIRDKRIMDRNRAKPTA